MKPDLDKVIARWNESVETISAAKDKNVNPFLTNVPLPYLMKTSGNWGSSDIPRSYRGGTLVEKGLRKMYGNKMILWQYLNWEIFYRLLSNKKASAIPSPLLNVEIILNFSQKTAILNKYSASQCFPLQNSSSSQTFCLRSSFLL